MFQRNKMQGVVLSIALALTVGAQQVDIDKQSWLDEHNARRRSEGASNMQQIVWSNELEALALDWASRCYAPNRLPTSSRPASQQQTASYEQTGENIDWSSSKITPQQALDNWHAGEKALWDYPSNRCSGDWTECAHYTQVVWASTCAVGCAQVQCPSSSGFEYIVVCNYGPAGNTVTNTDPSNPIFEQVYIKGSSCSQCTSGCSNDGQLCNPVCRGDSVDPPTTPATTGGTSVTDATSTSARSTKSTNSPTKGAKTGNRRPIIPPTDSLPPSKLWPTDPTGPIGRPTLPNESLGAGSQCVDEHQWCGFWASVGECARNAIYMHASCCRSCAGLSAGSVGRGSGSGARHCITRNTIRFELQR